MKTLPRVRRAVVRPKLLFFWNWTPKNIPDQQKHVGFQKSKKVRNHSPYCLYIMDRRQRLVWTTVLYSNWKKTVFIIIMDPPGVFIVFYTFYMFSYTYTDTDNRTDGCCNFLSALAGTRSWDLGDVLGFSSYLWQFFFLLQIRCYFCFTITVGQTHFLQGSFSVDPYMMANPFGSHA